MHSSDVATAPDLTPDTIAVEAFVSVRANNALHLMAKDAETLTLRGVAERFYARDFLRRQHVGRRTVDYIQAVLAKVGLRLREEPAAPELAAPEATSKGAADVWTLTAMSAESSGIVRLKLVCPRQPKLILRRTAPEAQAFYVGQKLHVTLEPASPMALAEEPGT